MPHAPCPATLRHVPQDGAPDHVCWLASEPTPAFASTGATRVSVGVAATDVPLLDHVVPRKRPRKSAPSQHISAQLPNATTEEAAAARRERDAATEEAAAARRERDAATEKAATACRARDAAIKKAAAAAKRADAWLTVARKMSNTASGRVFLAECPRELQEDVRKPYHAGSQPTM